MKVSAASNLERRRNESGKTLRRRIAAKFRMNLKGSLIKLNQISGVLMHERFFSEFYKIMENYKN